MKKINFKEFKMFMDIAHERFNVADMRKSVADVIYKNSNGVMALDLAMRIYKSDGEIELNPEELSFMEQFVNTNTTAMFIDSYRENLHD